MHEQLELFSKALDIQAKSTLLELLKKQGNMNRDGWPGLCGKRNAMFEDVSASRCRRFHTRNNFPEETTPRGTIVSWLKREKDTEGQSLTVISAP
jgi:hypothetical protein